MKPQIAIASAGPHPGIGFREFVALNAAMIAMMALGIDTMLPALPQIGASLGVADENERQWIILVFVLGFGVSQLLYGPLSDRYGRRPLLLGGMVGYAIASIGVSVAPSFAMVLTMRALQGIAIASVRVVATSMVRDCYAGRQMARVMSLTLIIFLAVPILAPSIGQVIMLFVSWRGLFLVLTGYSVIVFLWAAMRLPETLHPEYRRPIRLGPVLRGYLSALKTRQAIGYMVAIALFQGGLLGFISSIEQIFADDFRMPKAMPAIFASIASMMGVASYLNSRLVERLGTRRVGHSALLLFVAVQGVHVSIALAGGETVWSFAILQGLTFFCLGLATGNFSAIAMEPLAAMAGTAASLLGFVQMIGGSAIGAVIGQSFDGTTMPLAVGFAAVGVASLIVVLATERGRLLQPQMGA